MATNQRTFRCPECGRTTKTAIRGDYPETGVYCYGRPDKDKRHRKRVMEEA